MDTLNQFLRAKFGQAATRYSKLPAAQRRPDRFKPKAVQKAFHLPVETAVIVPSTKNLPRKKGVSITPAEFERRVEQTRRYMSNKYGGYTSVRAVGGYVYRKGKLKGGVAKEGSVVVTAYATKDAYRKNKAKWLAWVRAKRKAWKQESVGIIIENDMYYV